MTKRLATAGARASDCGGRAAQGSLAPLRNAPLAAMLSASALRATRLSIGARHGAALLLGRRARLAMLASCDAVARRPGQRQAERKQRGGQDQEELGAGRQAVEWESRPAIRSGPPRRRGLAELARAGRGSRAGHLREAWSRKPSARPCRRRPLWDGRAPLGLRAALRPGLVATTVGERIAVAAFTQPSSPSRGCIGFSAVVLSAPRFSRRVDSSVGAHLYPRLAPRQSRGSVPPIEAWKPKARCFVPTNERTPGDEYGAAA